MFKRLTSFGLMCLMLLTGPSLISGCTIDDDEEIDEEQVELEEDAQDMD